MSIHVKRLEEQIKKEVSKILLQDLGDPRIRLASVSKVSLKNDFRAAAIYISVLDPLQGIPTVNVLNNARKRVRWLLAHRIRMRRIPSITFYLDKTW